MGVSQNWGYLVEGPSDQAYSIWWVYSWVPCVGELPDITAKKAGIAKQDVGTMFLIIQGYTLQYSLSWHDELNLNHGTQG